MMSQDLGPRKQNSSGMGCGEIPPCLLIFLYRKNKVHCAFVFCVMARKGILAPLELM